MKNGLYTSGEFAKKAHITKKTVRYYDAKGILKPSSVNENGNRFYTDEDFARLQQILLLKYLGFSLDEIRELRTDITNTSFLADSLSVQLKLVENRIEEMQQVADAIRRTRAVLENGQEPDWQNIGALIRMTEMEKSLKTQYENASNLSDRIRLHSLYAENPEGWYPWLFRMAHPEPGMRILELGCGDGSFWTANRDRIPWRITAVLTDISEGMLMDARRNIGPDDSRFDYRVCDCEKIPWPDGTFDLVFANHVLFYCTDIPAALAEMKRVLKEDGRIAVSTYGRTHMREINELAAAFDDRVVLSAEKLYEKFGKENGGSYLETFFSDVRWTPYEDRLFVTDADPLVAYILSCHGNQRQYILPRYREFRSFVKEAVGNGFSVTKDAGVFTASAS